MANRNAESGYGPEGANRPSPMDWWKGAGLPEEKIRPWEGGIQLFAEGLKGFMKGYTDIKDRLYLGLGEGKIPPNLKSIYDVTKITWDAANDPLIGSYMDRRRYDVNVHRWIMRLNATLSPLFILLQCFDFGLKPLQRVILWIAISTVADVMSTANAVSETKIWAGITPLTEQRSIVQLCKTIGNQLASAASGIPMLLMGLKDVLNWSDYQIMIWGAMIFAPLTILCRWLPSFAKQRVDFRVKVQGEDEEGQAEKKRPPTFWECFAVVKHNRWFIMTTVVNLLKMFVPRTDYVFLYRFLPVPSMTFRGKKIGGEVLYVLKNVTFGVPSVLFQPLAIKVVGKFKDKISFLRTHKIIILLTNLAAFLVGYQTWPRMIFFFVMEMSRELFDRWSPVPEELIRYEMLDYVEWKTGQRSEGMTAAVDGMINKLIRDNIGNVFGNAVLQWTGYLGWDFPASEQPQRFLNSIWPLLFVGRTLGEVFMMFALFWFKYPHDPKEVEADLIERRALAQEMKEEAGVTG